MSDREDLLRVDATGTVHPVGRTASQQLRSRSGEWRFQPSPKELIFLREEGAAKSGRVLKLAGEIRTPGGLCDVVALIAQSSWHGELLVLDEAGSRALFFDGGNLAGATTTVPDERLGETLYRFGVVTREQLETVISASASSGKRIGEAAIELEYVSAEELYPMMARQAEEVFYGALHVGQGMFYFFDRYDEKSMLRRHNLNASGLLMEGARRMDEMRFFREKVPNDGYIPVPIPRGEKKPPDELGEVWSQCDGKRDIAEIGRRTGQLEFEVTRHIFQLINGGFLHMVAPRVRGPEAIVDAFNPGLVAIHEKCDAAGKGGELREGLSRFATGGGVYDPLFQGAGPLENGTFKSDRLARNLGALAGEDPDAWLMQLLHEYVGFAMFHAGSLLPREAESALVNSVTELLKPVRAAAEGPASQRGAVADALDALEMPDP
jgi:Domain of unknown function (DUF4388)